MATFSIEIPDENVDMTIEALASIGKKPEGVEDGAWAKENVRKWIITRVKVYEENKAKEAVMVAVDDTLIPSEIVIS